MKVVSLTEIEKVLPNIDPMPLIEDGFVDYSAGKCTIPPVGELLMEKGDIHIKYGCSNGGDYYVVKIASGFYSNNEIGLPTSNGMMLLFDQNTGMPAVILHDECYLTDVRTAVAGAISAKYLAPKNVKAIGIVGTGIQARMQLEYLKPVTDCKNVVVWGRNVQKAEQYKSDMEQKGYSVTVVTDLADLCEKANLIVTTTPSEEVLITADMVKPGTHITAMGSDTLDKKELDPEILKMADKVVVDSVDQSETRGEIMWARKAGMITNDDIVELGTVIANGGGRDNDDQITIADLTGVAVQDLKIAEAVFKGLS
ncbi:hypothetical protein [Pseudemcibacter aquimaris]|uniref:hypothetical protein n=1 Tax=Pseudemcibacter aquimaris TaxID=2857064 RepID=UPI00201200BC|nr:hypothetical protein [Pseudemcibacter aquimaris]MCC3860954.1 hypothetical protein [Pseudemcibacter aquimaris]WDU59772.1 hypothetical protein KW060_05825 [Pseudemcibacter aquimaris]